VTQIVKSRKPSDSHCLLPIHLPAHMATICERYNYLPTWQLSVHVTRISPHSFITGRLTTFTLACMPMCFKQLIVHRHNVFQTINCNVFQTINCNMFQTIKLCIVTICSKQLIAICSKQLFAMCYKQLIVHHHPTGRSEQHAGLGSHLAAVKARESHPEAVAAAPAAPVGDGKSRIDDMYNVRGCVCA